MKNRIKIKNAANNRIHNHKNVVFTNRPFVKLFENFHLKEGRNGEDNNQRIITKRISV